MADAKSVARSRATESLADSEPKIPGTGFPESAGEGKATTNGVKAWIHGDGKLTILKDGQVFEHQAPKLAQLIDEAGTYLSSKGAYAKKTLARGAEAMASMGSKAAPSALGGAAARVGGALLGLPVAAFLMGMDSTSLNDGEDEQVRALNSQTQGAMGQAPSPQPVDPGMNPQAPPTMSQTPSNTPDTDVGRSMPQAATMTDNVTGKVPTKGGDFPTYAKHSGEAADFRTAFANAVSQKAGTFMWQGREYNTKIAGR